MRAVVARAGRLSVEDVAEPVPGPGQLLAAPVACGVCGSDVHGLGLQAAQPDEYPAMILGHEFCVEVLERRPGTPAHVKAGSLVCSMPFLHGPAGPELLGYSPNFPGAFGERMVLDESRLLVLPDGFDPLQAAVTEPLAVGFHAVARAQVQRGDVALVIGCGPIGLAVIAALRAGGHGPIVAAEYSPARRALAEALGADVVVDPAAASPYETWLGRTGVAPPPSPLLEGVNARVGNTVVFECVGVPGLLQQVFDAVPQHTRVVVVGVCMQPDPIVPMVAITKELALTFVFAYRPEEFAAAFRAIVDGTVDVAPWITGTFGLAQAADALAALADPQHHCKVLVTAGSP